MADKSNICYFRNHTHLYILRNDFPDGLFPPTNLEEKENSFLLCANSFWVSALVKARG